MINEGANIVHDGIAFRPLDIDVALIHGFGFPRHRGGPMHQADRIGLDTVLAHISRFAKEDPLFWRASPLIVDLVNPGKDFSSLNS